VKIREVINEVFGTKKVKDPYSYDYEKDPETGEYTGREKPDPQSFTSMLKGVGDRLGAGSGSMWIDAPDKEEDERVNRYKVKPGFKLTVNTKDGREYYKLPAKQGAKDPTGYWTDAEGREIHAEESVKALESLINKNGRLSKIQQQPDQAADSGILLTPDNDDGAVGEPSTSEPLHPDVSIVQSVPLVIQYKGKRFEMDDYGEFHPFGTTKKVTPALQTFLTKERGKL
jgi:hypothetical protein